MFDAIQEIAAAKHIEAGCVISCVGSLRTAALRFANHDSFTVIDGFFEIVPLTGTISAHGSHLHLSASGAEGKTLGGHMESGCKIHITAEIVILAFENEVYKREYAEDSGYDELVVYPLP